VIRRSALSSVQRRFYSSSAHHDGGKISFNVNRENSGVNSDTAKTHTKPDLSTKQRPAVLYDKGLSRSDIIKL
jgi:hypothetical protein